MHRRGGLALLGLRPLHDNLTRQKLSRRRGQLWWASNRTDRADGLRVAQVGVDRSDHDAGFDRDQVDADQGDAYPRVDDDAFVQNAVKDVDETRAAWGSFN